MENKYENVSPHIAVKMILNDTSYYLSKRDIRELMKIIITNKTSLMRLLCDDYLNSINIEKVVTIIEEIPNEYLYILLKTLHNETSYWGDITYRLLKDKGLQMLSDEKRVIVESIIVMNELDRKE